MFFVLSQRETKNCRKSIFGDGFRVNKTLPDFMGKGEHSDSFQRKNIKVVFQDLVNLTEVYSGNS